MFTRGSRYEAVGDTVHLLPDGRRVPMKRIRFLPEPATGGRTVAVEEGDRPDLLAHRVAEDPEGYWRLCDANGVMRPAELVATPGRRVELPAPEGR
ncbi:MAG: LysM domain-containing protein [Sphingomonadaceae bacterium]